jgi:hypothetical protein
VTAQVHHGIGTWVNADFRYFALGWALVGWLLFGPRPRMDWTTLSWLFAWPLPPVIWPKWPSGACILAPSCSGIAGSTMPNGLTAQVPADARANRATLAASRRTIAVAYASKLRVVAFSTSALSTPWRGW